MKRKKTPPRQVPCRDDFYMGMAFWAAAKSKDPHTQIGAFIVSQNGEALGWGYNGPPPQFDDDKLDWSRPGKYDFLIHSENNAIEYSDASKLPGSTIYVTHQPCKRCMLKIVQKNIARVVYFDSPTDPGSMFNVQKDIEIAKALDIAKKAKKPVKVVKFKGNLNWMEERMKIMKSMGIFD